MKLMRCLTSWVIVLGSVLLSACSNAPPTTLVTLPVVRQLSAVDAPRNIVISAELSPVLIVRRSAVPEYLDVNAVRYRLSEERLAEWPHTEWAERPAMAMTRELMKRLRVLLPGWTVCDTACPSGAKGWVLYTEWAQLDYMRLLRELRADVRFTVSSPAVQSMPKSGALKITKPVLSDSPFGQVAAMASVVDDVAPAIVQAMP